MCRASIDPIDTKVLGGMCMAPIDPIDSKVLRGDVQGFYKPYRH